MARTGLDSLRETMGGSASQESEAPRAERRQTRKAAPVVEQAPRFAVTTFRIRADQMHALRLAALDLAAQRGAGKADASEVLRNILDEWMARGTR